MLKSISNSKLFFVALGITVGLAGMHVYAGPAQESSQLRSDVSRIANELERIRRDGIKMEVRQAYGSTFKVDVAK